MSYNNKWFLFYNRQREALCVYELSEEEEEEEEDHKGPGGLSFEFELHHDLDIENCFMFLHMHSIDVDPIAYYRANVSQIKIDNHGCVKLCYVENLPIANVKSIDS